jgi:hypothetical protein
LTPFQSKAPVSAGRCLVEEAVPNWMKGKAK